jgi:hypothetical protein
LLEKEAVMVQPFLPTFYATGEHALIFLGGVFTHAMRKRFALMEGLDQAGQQCIPVSEEEQAFAREVLSRLPTVPLYARVDLVRDHRHTLVLNELELIEPVLYLSHAPQALGRLTEAVRRRTRQAAQQRPGTQTEPLHQHVRQGRPMQEALPLVGEGVGGSSVPLLSRR